MKKFLYTYDVGYYSIPDEDSEFGGWDYTYYEHMFDAVSEMLSYYGKLAFEIKHLDASYASIYFPTVTDVHEHGITHKIYKMGAGKPSRIVYGCDKCQSAAIVGCDDCRDKHFCLECGYCSTCKEMKVGE